MRRSTLSVALLSLCGFASCPAAAQDAGPEAAPTEAAPTEAAPTEAEADLEAPPEPPTTETDPENAAPEAAAPEALPAEEEAIPELDPSPREELIPDAPLPEAPASEDAEADELAPREVVGSTPRHLFGRAFGVWLELGFSGGGRGDERADFVFSPEAGVRFRPDRGIYVGASFGFAAAATAVSGEVAIGGEPTPYRGSPGRIDPGNPTMELGYSGAVAPNLRLEVGVGAAIPTAARAQAGSDAPTLVERAASEVTLRSALSMRGYWSPWAWAPERFGLYLPVRVAAALGDLHIEGDLGLGVMIPVLGDRGIDADVIVQLGAGVSGRVAEPLYLGVRLRGVGSPLGVTLPGTDATGAAASEAVVFSAEPWVRLRFDPVQVTLRGVVSFNGADGVAGDRAPPFGVFVGVGGEVD
ncbi:MAG: hypothetical protein H6719_04890 [Sandaracinaceae bacterium]|nr:hypothetical protein [Sandaracinaceae bacterium]